MNRHEFYDNLNKYKSNSLTHYGTLGQKWGVRKWQNYDGTFNEAGKERYFGSTGKKKSTTEENDKRQEKINKKVDRQVKTKLRQIKWYNKNPFRKDINIDEDTLKKYYQAYYDLPWYKRTQKNINEAYVKRFIEGIDPDDAKNLKKLKDAQNQAIIINQHMQQMNQINEMNRINNEINQINSINQMNQINELNQLNQLEQINQINQMNQINQLNQLNQINQMQMMNTMTMPGFMGQPNNKISGLFSKKYTGENYNSKYQNADGSLTEQGKKLRDSNYDKFKKEINQDLYNQNIEDEFDKKFVEYQDKVNKKYNEIKGTKQADEDSTGGTIKDKNHYHDDSEYSSEELKDNKKRIEEFKKNYDKHLNIILDEIVERETENGVVPTWYNGEDISPEQFKRCLYTNLNWQGKSLNGAGVGDPGKESLEVWVNDDGLFGYHSFVLNYDPLTKKVTDYEGMM